MFNLGHSSFYNSLFEFWDGLSFVLKLVPGVVWDKVKSWRTTQAKYFFIYLVYKKTKSILYTLLYYQNSISFSSSNMTIDLTSFFWKKKDGYLILILKRISSSELLWNVAFNTEFVFFYSQHIKLPNLLKLAWFLNKEIIRLGDLEDMFPRYSINQMDNAMKRLLNSKNFIHCKFQFKIITSI